MIGAPHGRITKSSLLLQTKVPWPTATLLVGGQVSYSNSKVLTLSLNNGLGEACLNYWAGFHSGYLQENVMLGFTYIFAYHGVPRPGPHWHPNCSSRGEQTVM